MASHSESPLSLLSSSQRRRRRRQRQHQPEPPQRPKPKKRRAEDQNSTSSMPDRPSLSPTSSLFLRNWLLSISTLTQATSFTSTTTTMTTTRTEEQVPIPRAEEEDHHQHPQPDPCEGWSYQQVKQLCLQYGARVSTQVHGRVQAVVASPAATGPAPTQRVRKAWTQNIPVVSWTWLYQSRLAQQALPLAPFVIPPPSPEYAAEQKKQNHSRGPKPKKRKKNDDNQHDEGEKKDKSYHPGPSVLPLGCCCVCHEDDDPHAAAHCPWCQGQACSPPGS